MKKILDTQSKNAYESSRLKVQSVCYGSESLLVLGPQPGI